MGDARPGIRFGSQAEKLRLSKPVPLFPPARSP